MVLAVLLGCSSADQRPALDKAATADPAATGPNAGTLSFHPLGKSFITGDFDGDSRADSLFQFNFSHLRQVEIDSAPDPMAVEWDAVARWFQEQESEVYLLMNNGPRDTLHLGMAQGLYCLLNLGDLNADGKDEVALVVDLCDFSQVNSCKIYSLCQGKWTALKQFHLLEDAFDFEGDVAPVFTQVPGFLEKQNGHWAYRDYMEEEADNGAEAGPSKKLQLSPCK